MSTAIQTSSRRPRMVRLAAALAIALLLASCGSSSSDSDTAIDGPAGAARCFAFSIDQVGRGNLERGIERFDDCLADEYQFEFVFFEGGPSVTCPSAECPIQEFSSPGDLRARFANDFFVNAGYLATQHQILNVDVTSNGDSADVFAYIQANHFLPDNSVDIAWNDYSFETVRDGDRWLVTNEVIVGTAFLNFDAEPVG